MSKQYLTLTCPPLGITIQWRHVTRRRGTPLKPNMQALCTSTIHDDHLTIGLCFLAPSPDKLRQMGLIVHESVHAAFSIAHWLELRGNLTMDSKEEAIAELSQCIANIGFKWAWNQCDPNKGLDVYAWMLDVGLKYPGMIREAVWT